MNGLLDDMLQYIADYTLWQPGATVLVAVSGGPDSLCLLHLLCRIRASRQLVLHVAHLDHQLRPAAAAADADFVARTAAAWDVRATIESRAVRPLAPQFGGIEAAARAVRYGFLRDTALAVGAHVVATGHHADDQAETVLQRLLRGAGPTGLAGMRPCLAWARWQAIGFPPLADAPASGRSPALVRPLLATPRATILDYCAAHQLEPRHDESNQSPDYLRNRVRGYIIPELKAYNSNIVGALVRTARICADEDALLAELLDQQWPELAEVSETRVQLDRERLARMHRALCRRALRRAASSLAPEVEIGADHLDRMLRLLTRPHGRLQLPGALWMRVAPDIVIVERGRAG